jgi:hypothetical protein
MTDKRTCLCAGLRKHKQAPLLEYEENNQKILIPLGKTKRLIVAPLL